ncbi:MAG: hypothetical protein AAF203_08180 [Pseudomonadota bacterium]
MNSVKTLLIVILCGSFPYFSQAAKRATLTNQGAMARLKGGTSKKAIASVLNAMSGFRVKLPAGATSVAATITAVVNQEGTVQQNYMGGPEALNVFASQVGQGLREGHLAAGLHADLNLIDAQKVVSGLVTGLLLLESQGVPACEIGPIRVGTKNVKGCVQSATDQAALETYLVSRGVEVKDMTLYSKARNLMVAMIGGAGLNEYKTSTVHGTGQELAYARLWKTYLDIINKQGQVIFPVLAFVQAFEEVYKQTIASGNEGALAAVVGINGEKMGDAMDNFFSACAPRMGI